MDVEHVAVQVYWYVYQRNTEILDACTDSVYQAVFSSPSPNVLGTKLSTSLRLLFLSGCMILLVQFTDTVKFIYYS